MVKHCALTILLTRADDFLRLLFCHSYLFSNLTSSWSNLYEVMS